MMLGNPRERPLIVVPLLLILASALSLSFAQTTVGTGSIVGTVTDPSGAMIGGAKVTITNLATRQIIN